MGKNDYLTSKEILTLKRFENENRGWGVLSNEVESALASLFAATPMNFDKARFAKELKAPEDAPIVQNVLDVFLTKGLVQYTERHEFSFRKCVRRLPCPIFDLPDFPEETGRAKGRVEGVSDFSFMISDDRKSIVLKMGKNGKEYVTKFIIRDGKLFELFLEDGLGDKPWKW